MVRDADCGAANATRGARERRGAQKEGGPCLTHFGGTACTSYNSFNTLDSFIGNWMVKNTASFNIDD